MRSVSQIGIKNTTKRCVRGTIRPMSTRILVFGDSIVYGAWDTAGGWVERIKAAMHLRTVESAGSTKVQVLNMGVGGDSSTKLLARLEHDITSRHSASWPFAFVFSFGANDERTKDGIVETTIKQFETNVKEIIDLARQYSDRILFLGIVPLAQSLVTFKDQEYSDERIRHYDDILQRVVEDAGLRYVPLRLTFASHSADILYAYDNIHCNDKGHALIADVVLPVLDNMLSS